MKGNAKGPGGAGLMLLTPQMLKYAAAATFVVGPGRYCSTHHRMPIKSRKLGFNILLVDMRAIPALTLLGGCRLPLRLVGPGRYCSNYSSNTL